MKRLLIALALGGGGCGGAPVEPAGTGATTGSGSASTCDAVRGKVEQLYRDSARGQDAARVAELVADNTIMVMNDCRQSPQKTATCISTASTSAELEARCLIPLDDEGSEGDRRTR